MLVRICGSCGRKVLQGQQCECQKQRYKIYNREHRDRGRAAFYDSPEWRATAEAARARAGYCDEYMRAYDGRLAPGNVVHHIHPIDEAPGRRLDLSNLVVVSAKTHDHIHREYKAGGDRKALKIAMLEAIRASGQD